MTNVIEQGDANANASTAYSLAVGDSFIGSIDRQGDEDWIAINFDTIGDGYYVTMTPTGGGLNATLSVKDASGTTVAFENSNNSGLPVNTIFVGIDPGRPAGVYYLSARGYAAASTGSYTITTGREVAQTDATNATLTSGQSLNVTFEFSSDVDLYRAELLSGYSYAFVMTPLTDTGSVSGAIGIRHNNQTVSGFTYADGISVITRNPGTDDTYFIRASDIQTGTSGGLYRPLSPSPSFRLDMIREDPADHSSGLRMTANDTFDGLFDYRGDADSIGIDLIQGEIYDFRLAAPGVDGPTDLRLGLTSAGGSVTTLEGTGSDADTSHIAVVATRSGMVFVTASSDDPLQTGAYQISAFVRGLVVNGTGLDERIEGLRGNDTLNGSDGSDTLVGGAGDDFLYGGDSETDLRDVIYGGDGNDSLDGGYGNDELRGDAGADSITGGFGVDTIIGGTGDDLLTGQAWSDLIFGGDGNDFINGGFGFDRLNGGAGADKFFHLGIRDHGSDWIQDYNAADGDVLQFGGPANTAASDFLIQRATTPTAGADAVREIFVTQISTGNLLWALVDGDAQAQINIQIGAQVFDLLA